MLAFFTGENLSKRVYFQNFCGKLIDVFERNFWRLELMKKIYLLSAVAAGLLALSSQAQAYDSTGCGLGSMAWRGQSGLVPQVLAVTTNGTFGTQTFGITTGTSGCDPNGRVSGGTGRMLLAFLENNMEQFALDAAAGQGETLTTVAGILNVDEATFALKVQNNFGTLFASNDVDAVDLTLAVMKLA